MSPAGAYILSLFVLVLLGSLAAWLLNIPIWAIAGFSVVGVLLIRKAFRRVASRRARQDTEARP